MGFRGFDEIANLTYEQRTFRCRADPKCDNECNVVQITTDDGRKLHYGDVCERYSALDGDKKRLDFENPFITREKILMSYHQLVDSEREEIGIPRIGMFNELFPPWTTFFQNLGYNTVPSSKTNKRIISKGLEAATANFCFPFKVAFGQIADLDGKVARIFVPEIIQAHASKYSSDGKEKEAEWDRSTTCLYLQSFGKVIVRRVTSTPLINPHIDFRKGKTAVVTELTSALNSSGLDVSRDDVSSAYKNVESVYRDFKRKLRTEGEKLLANLPDKSKGIVILGRPYSSYDPLVNLNLALKIEGQGFVPIPQDYLPLPELDLSTEFSNLFNVQAQNLMNAAAVAKNLGLNPIFLSYFGCGMNACIEEIVREYWGNEKPFQTAEIDEHSGDAGLLTRVEAWLDTLR